MDRMQKTTVLSARRRGASVIEYVILVGAVALLVLGVMRIFGSRVKEKISGQGDSVVAMEGAAPGEGSKAPAEKDDGKEPSKGSGAGDGPKAASNAAPGNVAMGTKATIGTPRAGEPVTLSKEPEESKSTGFNYGWVLAVAGTLVFVAVLVKGARQSQKAGAEDKK